MDDFKPAFWDKYQLDITLQWRTMQAGEKYVCYEKGCNSPNALQIEVSSKNLLLASKVLRQEYDSNKKKVTYWELKCAISQIENASFYPQLKQSYNSNLLSNYSVLMH